MTTPYTCPSCKTNRTRFHIIEQVAQAVKLNPETGAIVEKYEAGELQPFHLPYQGPSLKIQCGACGLIENESMFSRRAQA
ncbi:hypothetical protein BTS2_3716 [Bacillus sp. TS-2]|nr:hypothetical protein BTS2_3716 [Bacillus sp. TS-2]